MILVSIAAHDQPQAVVDLYRNMKRCYGNHASMVVHLSRDTREGFLKHAAVRNVNLFRKDMYWNNMPVHTRQGTVLPMHVSNFIYAKSIIDLKFSHFQILSPSNMIIGRDVHDYVFSYDVLLKPTQPIEKWVWADSVKVDARFSYFRNRFGLGEPVCARADGICCRIDIFAQFVRDLFHAYSFRDMETFDPIYPLDETVLPTYLEKFRGSGISFASTRARAFEPNEPEITVDAIRDLIANKFLFVKRIPAASESEVRRFILSEFSEGATVP